MPVPTTARTARRPREQPRGQARARRGARCRDRVAVHQRDRGAGGGVEDGDHRLVGRVVPGEQRDELDRHRRRVVGVRAHQQEGAAAGHLDAGARRHRGPAGAERGERVRQRLDQRVGVERALDVGAAEHAQPQSPAPQVSGSLKPAGNGSSGSSTNWWKPVIQARPEIAGTIASVSPTVVREAMRPTSRVSSTLSLTNLVVADQAAGGEHGEAGGGRGARGAAVEAAGGDDGGVAGVAAVARRGR